MRQRFWIAAECGSWQWWSHRKRGIGSWAFQKSKTNFLSTQPKIYCFLSLPLGHMNELWGWEEATGAKEQQSWISAVFNKPVPGTDTSTHWGCNIPAGRAALMQVLLILVSQQWPSRWNLMIHFCHQCWDTSVGKGVVKDFFQEVPKGLGSPG